MTKTQAKPTAAFGVLLAAIAMGLLATGAYAGSAVMQSSDGESMRYEYRGDTMRMSGGGEEGYFLIADGTLYVISYDGGEPIVIDAGSMMQNFASMLPDTTPDELSAEVLEMSPTGRTERIADIKGEVYEVRIKDEDGEERTEEIVLSEDPKARELSKSLLRMAEQISGFLGKESNPGRDDISNRLAMLDAGFLRFGSDLVVTEISDAVVASERFELPAEPMDFGGMGALLSGMGAQDAAVEDTQDSVESQAKEGGAFSSMMKAFGKKVDRQVDRVSNSANNEVDRETDEAVDKGVNKIFGKLFRN